MLREKLMKLLGVYKGFDIEYLDHVKKFKLLIDGEFEYMNEDLDKVKAYIDRMLIKQFRRVNAFYLKGDSTPIYVEITGETEDGGKWITEKSSVHRIDGKGGRRKRQKYYGTLYYDSPENIELLKLLIEKDKTEHTLKEEKKSIIKQMSKYNANANAS